MILRSNSDSVKKTYDDHIVVLADSNDSPISTLFNFIIKIHSFLHDSQMKSNFIIKGRQFYSLPILFLLSTLFFSSFTSFFPLSFLFFFSLTSFYFVPILSLLSLFLSFFLLSSFHNLPLSFLSSFPFRLFHFFSPFLFRFFSFTCFSITGDSLSCL